MLCYSMPWEVSSSPVHDIQINMSHSSSPKQGSVSNLPLGFLLRYSTFPSTTQVKTNPHLLPPNTVPLPHFFRLTTHHPKGHSWPFSLILFVFYSVTQLNVIKISLSLVLFQMEWLLWPHVLSNLQVAQCLLNKVQVPCSSLCILPSSVLLLRDPPTDPRVQSVCPWHPEIPAPAISLLMSSISSSFLQVSVSTFSGFSSPDYSSSVDVFASTNFHSMFFPKHTSLSSVI